MSDSSIKLSLRAALEKLARYVLAVRGDDGPKSNPYGNFVALADVMDVVDSVAQVYDDLLLALRETRVEQEARHQSERQLLATELNRQDVELAKLRDDVGTSIVDPVLVAATQQAASMLRQERIQVERAPAPPATDPVVPTPVVQPLAEASPSATAQEDVVIVKVRDVAPATFPRLNGESVFRDLSIAVQELHAYALMQSAVSSGALMGEGAKLVIAGKLAALRRVAELRKLEAELKGSKA